MSNCSIISKSRTKKYTCLTLDDLKDISGKTGTKQFLIKEIEKEINKSLSSVEKTLYLYNVLPPHVEYRIKNLLFKPLVKSPYHYLKTTEINMFMRQTLYKINHPIKKYHYIGCYPADYSYNNIISNIHPKVDSGIILNTDPSYKKGQHWVAMSFNASKDCYYFDSLGDHPKKYKHIYSLLNKFKKVVIVNNKEYQKKDGLCGLYCINFLLCQIKNKKYCFNNTDKDMKSIFSQLIK
jgi:hypothetical protein